MKFYQIKNPTTQQIFDAILKHDYFTMEQIKPKFRQIVILLKNHFCCDDIYISFQGVTNSGGYPIIFSIEKDIYKLLCEIDQEFERSTPEEQDETKELFLYYAQNLETFFNN